MLNVEILKDLSGYKPKIVGSLTLRTLACLAGAIAASLSVLAYSMLILGIDFDHPGVMAACAASAVPFGIYAFVTPKGLPVEKWAPLWWRHNFGASQLAYANTARQEAFDTADEETKGEAIALSKEYKRFRNRRGCELWEPGADRVVEAIGRRQDKGKRGFLSRFKKR